MTDYEKLVPAHLHHLAKYKAGKPVRQAEQESGKRCIKMASNENPFGPSPLAIAAIKDVTHLTHFYPDNGVTELTARLAELHDIEPGNILVTSGSTSFLDVMARTLLGPGLNAITSKLSFIVYPIVTRATGAQFIEVPARNDGFDLDAILAAVTPHTRIVYIANPNNPTGTLLEADAIERFLDRLPPHVITVLDEAYCDFASYFAQQRGVEYSRSLDYVRQGRPVVVLRHLLQGAWTGRIARGLRRCASRADWLSGAVASGIHGVVAGRDCGAGCARRRRSRGPRGALQRRRRGLPDRGDYCAGHSRSADLGELSVLPRRAGGVHAVPVDAGRRRDRASHERHLGRARCVSRQHRHPRAE